MSEHKRYNEEFIDLMDTLSTIMTKQGEPFRARAYQKAQEALMLFPDDITCVEQLKGVAGIGNTISDKLKEYMATGTLRVIEQDKTNPLTILSEVYGIGPKKAQELVNLGITTIDELRQRQEEVLNGQQKIGLLYYNDIQQRIPRREIEEYESIFNEALQYVKTNCAGICQDVKFEIVGSYRRGADTSGDIDVIITSVHNNAYTSFVDKLLNMGIILEVLSKGPSKTLVISRLLGKDRIARRVDFLYTPPNEYPFAVLYFTGSKLFNTAMRQHGLNKGVTFNEHGMHYVVNKKKGEKVKHEFKVEKDIFDYLGLRYKPPTERKDGGCVNEVTVNEVTVSEVTVSDASTNEANAPSVLEEIEFEIEVIPKKNKTLKKKTIPTTNDADIVSYINDFKQNGIKVLESLTEKQLSEIIRLANDKYYNQNPIMSDNLYDIVKAYVEKRYPSNTVIYEIGSEVKRNKVKLPYPMGSQNKLKADTNGVALWTLKYKGPYIASAKCDGVSGLYVIKNNKKELFTRGDGEYGQDVSYLVSHLRLPKTQDIAIRGEFIISKEVFENKYKGKFANARNMVAGIVNHKHISEYISDVKFVAYQLLYPVMKPSEQIEFLNTLDIEVVRYETIDYISNGLLSDMLVKWRDEYDYRIDGIVLKDDNIYEEKAGNPEHAFAFKMVLSDQKAEANVVDVLWTPSKDGYLKPRVRIEPVYIGGVTIEYATGHNGAFIRDNKIGVGSVIMMIRSGDVIPYISEVIEEADEAKMPSMPYVWNDTNIDILLVNPEEDPTVKEKNITGFFKGIGVDGMGSGNVARLISAGYDSVPKIIGMSESDFLTVNGFKSKLANKLYTGIRDKIEEASLVTLMTASNVFGHGLSEKKFELIMTEFPDVLVSDISDVNKVMEISNLKGMADKTSIKFVEKINAFKEFLEECGLEDKLYQMAISKVDLTHELSGKHVVLTGTRDKNIITFLKNVGAIQSTSVSKNTSLVIAKNKEDDTGKAEDARKLGVPLISVSEFIQKYSVK